MLATVSTRVRWVLAATVLIAAVVLGVRVALPPDPEPTPTAYPSLTPSSVPSLSSSVVPSTESSPIPSPTSEPTPPAPDIAWTTLPWEGPGRDSSIHEVLYDEGTALWIAAAGSAIWISADLRTWEAAKVDDAECGPPRCRDGYVEDIVRHGSALIAVGIAPSDYSDAFVGLAWTSADGRDWQLIDESTAWGGHVISAASNGDLLVAAATVFGDLPAHGRISQSVDGAQWEDAEAADVPYLDVYGDADGFVAVGARLYDAPVPSGGPYRLPLSPVIATSSDGESWAEVDLQGETGVASSVARTADGRYFVASMSDAGALLVWRSTDAEEWARTRVAGEGSALLGSIEDGPRMAVFGDSVLLTAPTSTGPAAWISLDGSTWRAVSAPPSAGVITTPDAPMVVTAVAIHGRELVAFGVVRGLGYVEDRYFAWVGSYVGPD